MNEYAINELATFHRSQRGLYFFMIVMERVSRFVVQLNCRYKATYTFSSQLSVPSTQSTAVQQLNFM